ncbi:hypothetical protein OIU34_23810 [Pararhizobium sp. BT-229]|uniref:hypothetical protein n=1 Tax=Pararhizobium sp. BT-229 TaxID=2986923 RepID=UPI0021F7F649|nr:hypothetical protein [Pararhizobium sp. BT-229]MCV9964924.1 hypothetical protein [Pararhizobium sp. BT-229]
MPNPAKDFAKKFGVPTHVRWMNLDAYDMKLRLAVYKDGRALVMEGGDAKPAELAKLGFERVGDEWMNPDYSFQPGDYRNVFEDAKVDRTVPTMEIILDRTADAIPTLRPANPSLRDRVIAAAKERVSAPPQTPAIWFANADLGDHDVHAFGTSPVEAMKALLAAWSELAARERVDVDLISRYRDSISVNKAEIGKGYAKGIGDSGWYSEGFNGSDPIFEDLFGPAAPKNDRALRPR